MSYDINLSRAQPPVHYFHNSSEANQCDISHDENFSFEKHLLEVNEITVTLVDVVSKGFSALMKNSCRNSSELGQQIIKKWFSNAKEADGGLLEAIMNAHDAHAERYLPGEKASLGRFGEGCNVFFSLACYPQGVGSEIIYRTTYQQKSGHLFSYQATVFIDGFGELMTRIQTCSPADECGTYITVRPKLTGVEFPPELLAGSYKDTLRLACYRHGKTEITYAGKKTSIGGKNSLIPSVKVLLDRDTIRIHDSGNGIPLDTFWNYVLVPNKSTKNAAAQRVILEKTIERGEYHYQFPTFIDHSEDSSDHASKLVITVGGVINMEVFFKQDSTSTARSLELPMFPGSRQTANRKSVFIADKNCLESRYLSGLLKFTVDNAIVNQTDEGFDILNLLYDGLVAWEALEYMQHLGNYFSESLKEYLHEKLNQTTHLVPTPPDRINDWKAVINDQLRCVPICQNLAPNRYLYLQEKLKQLHAASLTSDDHIRQLGLEEKLVIGKTVVFLPDHFFPEGEFNPISQELGDTLAVPESLLTNQSVDFIKRSICDHVSPLEGMLEPYGAQDNDDSFLDRFNIVSVELGKREKVDTGFSNYFLQTDIPNHWEAAQSFVEHYAETMLPAGDLERSYSEIEQMVRNIHRSLQEESEVNNTRLIEMVHSNLKEHKDKVYKSTFFYDNRLKQCVKINSTYNLISRKNSELFKGISNASDSIVRYIKNILFQPLNAIEFVNALVYKRMSSHISRPPKPLLLKIRGYDNVYSAEGVEKLLFTFLTKTYEHKRYLKKLRRTCPSKLKDILPENSILLPCTNINHPISYHGDTFKNVYHIVQGLSFWSSSIQNLLFKIVLNIGLVLEHPETIGDLNTTLLKQYLNHWMQSCREQLSAKKVIEFIKKNKVKTSKITYSWNPFFPVSKWKTIVEALSQLKASPELCRKLFKFQNDSIPLILESESLWKIDEEFLSDNGEVCLELKLPWRYLNTPFELLATYNIYPTVYVEVLQLSTSVEEFLFVLNYFITINIENLDSKETIQYVIRSCFNCLFGKRISNETMKSVTKLSMQNDNYYKLFRTNPPWKMMLDDFVHELVSNQNRKYVTSFPITTTSIKIRCSAAVPFSFSQLSQTLMSQKAVDLLESNLISAFIFEMQHTPKGPSISTKVKKLVENRTSSVLLAIVKEIHQNFDDAVLLMKQKGCERSIGTIRYGIKILSQEVNHHLIFKAHDQVGMTRKALFKYFLMPDASSKCESSDTGGQFGNGSWVFQNADYVQITSRDPDDPLTVYTVTIIPNKDRSDAQVRYADISALPEIENFIGTEFTLKFPGKASFEEVAADAVHLNEIVRKLRFTKQSWEGEPMCVELSCGDNEPEKINRLLGIDIPVSCKTNIVNDVHLEVYDVSSEQNTTVISSVMFQRQHLSSLSEFIKNHDIAIPTELLKLVANDWIFSIQYLSRHHDFKPDQDRVRLLLSPNTKERVQTALLDSIYIAVLKKAMTDNSLMRTCISTFYEHLVPEQHICRIQSRPIAPNDPNFNALTLNEFFMGYSHSKLVTSLHNMISDLYYNSLEPRINRVRVILSERMQALRVKHENETSLIKVSQDVDQCQEMTIEDMSKATSIVDAAGNQLPNEELHKFAHQLTVKWFQSKYPLILLNTINSQTKPYLDEKQKKLKSPENNQSIINNDTVDDLLTNLSAILERNASLNQIQTILKSMVKSLSGNTANFQFTYSYEALNGFLITADQTIYFNLRTINLSHFLDLLKAFATNQPIFNRESAKLIISIVPGNEGVLVHELQHLIDNQSADLKLLNWHFDGPDRMGKRVSFSERACSWYEKRIFQGVIYSTRLAVQDNLERLGLSPYFLEGTPEADIFDSFVKQIEKIESCENGSLRIAELFKFEKKL
ncbi:MAG: hypothetical protein H7A37_00605 [Chlamydiales bacterium]|nr:hypothetical protein [Chlamydiia bacterium]MCP5506792.1 hypothetical protein [Chlamydiales bacterium]